MANGKLGSQAGWSNDYVANLDSTRQLTPSDSGKVFYLEPVRNTTSYYYSGSPAGGHSYFQLPKLSEITAGWNILCFIDPHQNSGAQLDAHRGIRFMANGVPFLGSASAGDNDTIVWLELSGTHYGSITADGIAFASTTMNSPNTLEVFTDGEEWFIYGYGGAATDIYNPIDA